MGGMKRDDNHRIFAPLTLVDGSCIGEADFIKLVQVIRNQPAVEVDLNLSLFLVYRDDSSVDGLLRISGAVRASATSAMQVTVYEARGYYFGCSARKKWEADFD